MKFYAVARCKLLKIFVVAFVLYVGHHNVCRLYREARFQNLAALGKQFEQSQRVLSARKRNKYLVALVDERILHQSFLKMRADALGEFVLLRQFFLFVHFIHNKQAKL